MHLVLPASVEMHSLNSCETARAKHSHTLPLSARATLAGARRCGGWAGRVRAFVDVMGEAAVRPSAQINLTGPGAYHVDGIAPPERRAVTEA